MTDVFGTSRYSNNKKEVIYMKSVKTIRINHRSELKRIEKYTYTTGAVEFSGPMSEADEKEYGWTDLYPLVPSFINEDGSAAADGNGWYTYWPAEDAELKFFRSKDHSPYYQRQYELYCQYYK